MENIGFVVIGRNEGQRLKDCLASIKSVAPEMPLCYVDSGSTDGSVEHAMGVGSDVVDLDMSKPFSAARARNEGWRYLSKQYPKLEYIQFLDGDCKLDGDWIFKAAEFLKGNPIYAVACGRRKELYPEMSTYNALCDHEWNTPIGDAMACGGDAFIRLASLVEVGGYKDYFVAGEEPEMCLRLRKSGWKIRRLDLMMTYHDANIMSYNQWWKRSVRCGYAYALGFAEHKNYKKRELLRAIAWGIVLPFTLGMSWALNRVVLGFCLFLICLKLVHSTLTCPKIDHVSNFRYSWLLLLGKMAEAQGILQFIFNKLTSSGNRIIEYKNS